MPLALLAAALLATAASAAIPNPSTRLSSALGRYEAVAANGGWGEIPDGPLVQPGEASADQVPALRARLSAEAALGDADPTGDTLDPPLVAALRRTQARLGLGADGVIGPKTRAALAVPAGDRAARIRRSLADLGALDLPASGRWVLVNVPEYRVRGFDDGHEVLTMRTVVGADADGWRTPRFADEIEYLVFRPFWNVPTSIALDELVSLGAERLAADGYQLVRRFSPDAEVHEMTAENLGQVAEGHLLVRQNAGPTNALGLLKVMLPNAQNIYLHDTPAKGYFARDDRALSHGCVRLEGPAAMGAWLLEKPVSEVEALMNGDGYQRVDLARRVPVVIAYLAAWAGDDGAVWFASDPYRQFS